jgi:hypothetical protein
MRTVLAAAAAGALIIGSAAGAIADETPAPAPVSPVVKIQKVDIHRHSPINVDKARDLKVRMTIRTPDKTPITAATITLAEYAKKSAKDPVAGSTVAPSPIPVEISPISGNADGTVVYISGVVKADTLKALGVDPDGAAVAPLAEGKTALLCISTASTVTAANAWSTQTMKRLGMDAKKPVRECVKVYNPKTKPAKKNS